MGVAKDNAESVTGNAKRIFNSTKLMYAKRSFVDSPTQRSYGTQSSGRNSRDAAAQCAASPTKNASCGKEESMLTFALAKNASGEYQYKTWKDGDEFPAIDDPSSLLSMAATGEELQMIRSIFVNLPDTTTDIVVFPNDIGRFVYLNLRVYLDRRE